MNDIVRKYHLVFERQKNKDGYKLTQAIDYLNNPCRSANWLIEHRFGGNPYFKDIDDIKESVEWNLNGRCRMGINPVRKFLCVEVYE